MCLTKLGALGSNCTGAHVGDPQRDMRGASGICQWFRTRTLARVVAKLCLAVMLANLFAPIAWATAASSPAAEPLPACHEPAPDEHPGHAQAQSNENGLTPHCPLCVLFGGTLWAPPVTTVATVAMSRDVCDTRTSDLGRPVQVLPATLRPSPRAPPALI